MIAFLIQFLGMAVFAGSEEMDHAGKVRERETIAALERADARVSEVSGELAVYCTRTDQLIELAARLARMSSLHASWFRDEPELTGPELRHLRGHKHLREIDIHRMPISGEHFEVLTTLPNLELLRTTPQGDVQKALVHIGNCKGLRELTLYYCQLHDADLESLRGLERLESLKLSHTPASSGVRVVRHFHRLKDLGLEDTRVDDDTLRVLGELPHLERLFIGSPNVTDAGVAHLVNCSALRTLSIESTGVTCRGVEKLAALPNLETLCISQTVPDPALLKALAKLPNLTCLNCNAGETTLETQIDLSALIPKCEIDWHDRQVASTGGTRPSADGNTPARTRERMDKHTSFQKLLAEGSDFDTCNATFLKIGDHYDHWIDASKYTPEERVVMLVWHSAGIIDNGGFEYLFSDNFDRDPDFRLTAGAFKTIGHEDACVAFNAAFKLFPNGQVPQDAEQRIELYKAQPAGARSAINRKFWRARTDGAKSTEKLLAAYIRKNAGAFKTLK